MKQISLFGFARCSRCGFSFALPDVESRKKCQEKCPVCPVCGNSLEVEE